MFFLFTVKRTISPQKIETECKVLSENKTIAAPSVQRQHFESQLSDVAKKKMDFDKAQIGKKKICLLSKPTLTDDSVIMSSDSESTTSSSCSEGSDCGYVATHSSNIPVLHKNPEVFKHQYSLRSTTKIDATTNKVTDTENVEEEVNVVNTEMVNKIVSKSEHVNLKHMEMLKVRQALEEKRKRIIDQLKMDEELKNFNSSKQCKRKAKPSVSVVRKKGNIVTKNGNIGKNDQHVNTTKLLSTTDRKNSLTLENNEDTKRNDGVEASLNVNSTEFPTNVENIQTAVISETNSKLPKCNTKKNIKKKAVPQNSNSSTTITKKKSGSNNDVNPKSQTNENLKPTNLKSKVSQRQTLNKEKTNIKSASLVTKEIPEYENKSVNSVITDDSDKEANALIRDLMERGIHLMPKKKNKAHEIEKINQIIDANLMQSSTEYNVHLDKLKHDITVKAEKLRLPVKTMTPKLVTLFKNARESSIGSVMIIPPKQHISDIMKCIRHTNEKEAEKSVNLINKELSINKKKRNSIEEGEVVSDDEITHDQVQKETAMSQLLEDLNVSVGESVEDLDFDTITISQENMNIVHCVGTKVISRSFDFIHKEFKARVFLDSGEEIVRIMKVSQFEIILDIPLKKIDIQRQSPLENIYTPVKQKK